MGSVSNSLRILFRACTIAMALLLIGAGPFAIPTSAAQLQQRGLRLSNSVPGATSNYEISMTLLTADTLGSIKVEFCSNLALLYYPCVAPAGFDVSGASVASQSGVSGFTVDPSTTANILVLSRAAAPVAPGPAVITLSGVINQSVEGASFARYYTHATTDATGPVTDDGAVAYSLNAAFGVSAEVPPYLTLCIGVVITNNDCSVVEGNFLQMGEFRTNRASSGQSQIAITTNAESGYTLRIVGQTMTSGNNVLPAMSSPGPSRVGSSQFGINLRANTNPASGTDPVGPGVGMPTGDYGQANFFKFASGDIIASGSGYEDLRKFTVTYLVNINRNQPPGFYTSSFSYIGLGNF